MTRSRAEALTELAAGMGRAGDGVPGEWNRFAVVAEITALGVRVTGFRYLDETPALPMLMDVDVIDSIAELRSASPGPNGELFDIYVARLDRSTGQIVDQAFSATTGAPYRVTAANVTRIAELVRPGTPLTGAEPAVAEPAVAVDQEPAPDPEPAADAGPAADPASAPDAQSPEPIADHQAAPDEVHEPAMSAEEAASATDDTAPAGEDTAPATDDTAPATDDTAPAGEDTASAAEDTDPAVPASGGGRSTEEILTLLTSDILELDTAAGGAGGDWVAYAGVVFQQPSSRHVATQASVGFGYGPRRATPMVVGGDFHAHLAELLAGAPQPDGAAPGAALLRLLDRGSQVQARFVYPPQSEQIRFAVADDELLARIRPRPDVGTEGLEPRTEPDLLTAGELQARAESDIAASLRCLDPWRTGAFALDVPRGRFVAFAFGADGTPYRFQPALSPMADLTELREQTARPDGAKWAGVVAHAWPQGRVDLMFYGDDAIARLLGGGPDASGPLVRPPADPPEQEPSAPWPPSGGHLDRNALTADVTSAILSAPELAGGDWDRVAVVVMVAATGDGSATGVTAHAVRFYGDRGHAVPTTMGRLGPIGKLSRAIAAEDGVVPDAVVLRGRRGARLDAYGFEGESAQRLAGGDARMLELSDWLRPT